MTDQLPPILVPSRGWQPIVFPLRLSQACSSESTFRPRVLNGNKSIADSGETIANPPSNISKYLVFSQLRVILSSKLINSVIVPIEEQIRHNV